MNPKGILSPNRALMVLAWLVLCGQALSAAAQAAADYPRKPVHLIVPYQPGGLGDTFARALGQGLSERMGQPVVIENLPGASQAIGAEAAAKAPPDGYTLFLASQSGLVFNAVLRKTLPFDPVRDFSPVSLLFTSPMFLVVNPALEARNVRELVLLARTRPRTLSAATIGEGTSMHVAALMLEARAGIQLLKVPYKGSASAITDVLNGTVDLMFEGGATALPHVRQGKLRALASTAEKRTEAAAPGLPTLHESLPGFVLETWFGVVTPAGVPAPIIDKLNQHIRAVQQSPRMKELALTVGADVVSGTPEQMARRMAADLKEFAAVMAGQDLR